MNDDETEELKKISEELEEAEQIKTTEKKWALALFEKLFTFN